MTPEDLKSLFDFLESTPELIRSLTTTLTVEELRWKPATGEFSFLEHICHLRDIEQEGYRVRIEKLLNEAQPFLPDIDGDKLAQERNYNSQNLELALNEFSQARKQNVRAISDLSADQLNRSGMFENVGAITLERLLSMMCEHDHEHLREIGRASCRERV